MIRSCKSFDSYDKDAHQNQGSLPVEQPTKFELVARLLGQLVNGLKPNDADRYLIRDAQRVIESIEALVRIHNAQEEDIYEHASTGHV